MRFSVFITVEGFLVRVDVRRPYINKLVHFSFYGVTSSTGYRSFFTTEEEMEVNGGILSSIQQIADLLYKEEKKHLEFRSYHSQLNLSHRDITYTELFMLTC